MWNDVLSQKGRQKQRKYICFSIVLAVMVLAVAIITAFPLRLGLRLQGMIPVETGAWAVAECTPGSRTASAENTLFCAAGNQILRWGQGTATAFSFNEFPVLADGELPVGFVPGERSVMLLSDSGKWVQIPGAVDAVMTGEDSFGVICSGSGYMTNTVIYDAFGNKLYEIGLVEEAMTGGCFLGDRDEFAALTFGTDGLWRLRFYLRSGELSWQYPFEADSMPIILSLGNRGALITDEEIKIFDDTGDVASIHSFGVWEPCMMASGRDILAIAFACRGEYRIMTVSSSGEILGQWELSQKPEDVKISARKVFVLESGCLLAYDAFGDLRLSSSEGARAGKLEASDTSVWLIGNGELMEIKTS